MFTTPENIAHSVASNIEQVLDKPLPTVGSEPYAMQAVGDEVDHQTRLAYSDIEAGTILLDLDEPPKGVNADVAAAMFPLAKVLRLPPNIIAETVAKSIADDSTARFIDSAEAVGPYVNVSLDRPNTIGRVLSDVFDSPAYGTNSSATGETHVLDYSAPNIAKKLGVQHLPTTIVGESLARISEANGARAVSINHLGDFGTPFGKVLLGVEKYGFDFDSADPIGQMHEIYVRIHAESKEDPETAAAAREKFMLLEKGDHELVALWSRLRELNVDENEQMYKELGIKFDATIGESYYVEAAQAITDRLLKAGIARVDEEGVVFVPGETIMEYLDDGRRIGNIVLRKRDGSTLYATRDLAAIEHRVREFEPAMIEYIVGSEQSEHFAAVFAIAGMSGIVRPETRLVHTKIGMLSGVSGKKLSSRDGTTQTMSNIMEDAYYAALASIQQRGKISDPDAQSALARVIANGAVAYPILKKDPSANTAFRDEADRAREARIAGSIQYTHARAAHILASEGAPTLDEMRQSRIDDPITDTEWRLVRAVMNYPAAVKKAGEDRSPSYVAGSVAEVAAAFNAFYEADSIRGAATRERMVARTALTQAAQITLHAGLELLNINAPREV